jgi:hypothetical protein
MVASAKATFFFSTSVLAVVDQTQRMPWIQVGDPLALMQVGHPPSLLAVVHLLTGINPKTCHR